LPLALNRRLRRRSITLACCAVVATAATAAPSQASVYFNNNQSNANSRIARASADGSILRPNFVSGPQSPQALATDGRRLYLADFLGENIARVNIDGTGFDPTFIRANGPTFGVATGPSSLFYNDNVSSDVKRAAYDGSGSTLLSSGAAGSALTFDGTWVYYGQTNTGFVGRVRPDGSDDTPRFINVGPGANGQNGVLGLAVAGTKLFIAQNQGLSSANTDGSGFARNTVDTGGSAQVYGLATDSRYLYYTMPGRGTIGRANLDGSAPNNSFITGAGVPTGIVSVPDTAAPKCTGFVVRRGTGGDQADVTITDTGSGIAGVTNVTVYNGTYTVAPFNPGDTSTTITVSKTNSRLRTNFSFDVTDGDGNSTRCK
jgi:hypothetical protein